MLSATDDPVSNLPRTSSPLSASFWTCRGSAGHKHKLGAKLSNSNSVLLITKVYCYCAIYSLWTWDQFSHPLHISVLSCIQTGY